jgi:hypothetical protein
VCVWNHRVFTNFPTTFYCVFGLIRKLLSWARSSLKIKKIRVEPFEIFVKNLPKWSFFEKKFENRKFSQHKPGSILVIAWFIRVFHTSFPYKILTRMFFKKNFTRRLHAFFHLWFIKFFIQVLHTSVTYNFSIQVTCTSFPYKLYQKNFYAYFTHFFVYFLATILLFVFRGNALSSNSFTNTDVSCLFSFQNFFSYHKQTNFGSKKCCRSYYFNGFMFESGEKLFFSFRRKLLFHFHV